MIIPVELLAEILGVFAENDLLNWSLDTINNRFEFYYYHEDMGCYIDEYAKEAVRSLNTYFLSDHMTFKSIKISADYRFIYNGNDYTSIITIRRD